MKKRVLSLLMALCLMLTLAPAAFAANVDADTVLSLSENAERTLIRPDGEEIEIPDITIDDVDDSIMLLSETDGVISLGSPQDFIRTDWDQGNSYVLTADVNLSGLYASVNEWGGLIETFRGNFNGGGHTITGVPENYCFIYGCIGGTIENVNFDLGGNAGFFVFMQVTYNGGYYHPLLLKDITVTGEAVLTDADQANYAPFVYCAFPEFVMQDCINYADLSGVTYASVFFGYCPLYTGNYTFNGCENHGDISYRNAALFFGNPSKFQNNADGTESTFTQGLNISILNCKNYGTIRSTATTPRYFVADLGNMSIYSQRMENSLTANTSGVLQFGLTCEDENCTKPDATHTGALLSGSDMDITMSKTADGTITITNNAANASQVVKYVVAVSSYVQEYDLATNSFWGTDRYSIEETIMVSDITTGSVYAPNGNSFNAQLKYYGLADAQEDDVITTTIAGHPVVTRNGQNYYQFESVWMYDEVYLMASRAVDEDGYPIGGTCNPYFATVAAYGTNGQLLGYAYI